MHHHFGIMKLRTPVPLDFRKEHGGKIERTCSSSNMALGTLIYYHTDEDFLKVGVAQIKD